MSGRKSSEVAQVLASSQKGREQTVADVENAMAETTVFAEKAGANIDRMWEEGNKLTTSPSDEARRYFNESAKHLESSLEESRAKIAQGRDCLAATGEIRQAFLALKTRLAEADSEAAEIRQAIAAKQNGWHCDKEYEQAQKLGCVYQEIFSGYAKILADCGAIRTRVLARENSARIQLDLARKFDQDLLNLNEIARKREESNALRAQLQKTWSALEPDFARKFFKDEYDALSAEVAASANWPDEETLERYGELAGQLENFSILLAEKIAQWQKARVDAAAGLEAMRDLATVSFIGPIEFFNKGDAGRREELFDFLEHYEGGSPRGKYERIAQAAREAFEREDFAGCGKLVEEGTGLLENARARALKLRENMLNKTYLAAELQKAMNSLGYNTSLGIFDDDNPNSGFRLGCYIGDENIDFDHIDINDDGSVALEINHKSVGSCGPSWTKIAGRLCELGIPVTDVRMANGSSVLYGARQTRGRSVPQGGVRARG